jgi:hypothetical protein
MAEAGVQFFSPPPTYYTEVCKRTAAAAAHNVSHMVILSETLPGPSHPACTRAQVKRQEIEAAGQRPERLAQHGILLDTDMRHDARDQTAENR